MLDIGSGAGDVALLLADLVGPDGEVVGVDANADILDTARGRVSAAGWRNVSFVHADVRDLAIEDDAFDAVVGRWILMYMTDPADLVRRAARGCDPAVWSRSRRATCAPAPARSRRRRCTSAGPVDTPPSDAPGPERAMGPKLFATFERAGLPTPQLRLDAPIGGGAGWPARTT